MNIFLHKSNALQTMYDSISVIGPLRHDINQNIISKYHTSSKSLDILAVAIAYSREGAKYRKTAILYYEKYLHSSTSIPNVKNCYPLRPLFTMWAIYSDLGTLYEREYEFEKAIQCYEKLIIESNGSNPADYTRIGDVLAKMSIDKCVEYYRDLQMKDCYNQHKYCFDIKLAEAIEKQAKGYVYKPRNNKKPLA